MALRLALPTERRQFQFQYDRSFSMQPMPYTAQSIFVLTTTLLISPQTIHEGTRTKHETRGHRKSTFEPKLIQRVICEWVSELRRRP